MQQLKEADRRKDEFLAALAHELRNPLASVRNAVQLLRTTSPNEPDFSWSRDVIDRQAEHLTRLTDDLLDISRVARGAVELRMQRVELKQVINEAVASGRHVIAQYGHTLTVTLPPDPIYLNGDPTRLVQVFINLLHNAAKYTETGGRIWLIAEIHDTEAMVCVRDTGIGIRADKLRHVFELFFQGDPTLERAQSGLGVGLSLVKRLVELHGGQVDVHSDGIGKGSEFIVRLPASIATA